MSERLGPITYTQDPRSAHLDLGFGAREREYSERTAQRIDEEIRILRGKLDQTDTFLVSVQGIGFCIYCDLRFLG